MMSMSFRGEFYDAKRFEVYRIKAAWLRYGDYEGWIEGNTISEIVSNLHVNMIDVLINIETKKDIHLLV